MLSIKADYFGKIKYIYIKEGKIVSGKSVVKKENHHCQTAYSSGIVIVSSGMNRKVREKC